MSGMNIPYKLWTTEKLNSAGHVSQNIYQAIQQELGNLGFIYEREIGTSSGIAVTTYRHPDTMEKIDIKRNIFDTITIAYTWED